MLKYRFCVTLKDGNKYYESVLASWINIDVGGPEVYAVQILNHGFACEEDHIAFPKNRIWEVTWKEIEE